MSSAIRPVPAPPDRLEDVLRTLLESGGEVVSPGDHTALEAAVRVEGDWKYRLECALPAVGLTLRWLRGGPAIALENARRDMPLVTWVDDDTGGQWVIVDAVRFNRVRVHTYGSSIGHGWRDPLRAFGNQERVWARVLPILGSTPLRPKGDGPATPTQRLRSILQAERPDIALVVIYALAIGTLSLATPLAIQILINWLAFGVLLQPIITISVALLACLALVATLQGAQRYAVEIIQRRIFARTVSDLSARLTRVRVESFDRTYGPELANRYFDVLTLQKAASALLLDGLAAALQALVGMILLALYHPLLLIFDILVVGSVVFVLFVLARGAQYSSIKESKTKYAVAAWMEELARHPLIFKLGGNKLGELRTDRLTHSYLDAREKHFRIFFRQYIGMQVIQVMLPVTLLVMTGWLVLEGQLTLGQLVAAEFIVASALAGVAKFTGKLETVYDLIAGVDKLGALFDLPLDRTHGSHREYSSKAATVELKEVRHGFPGISSLGPLELKLSPGSRAAILGGSGSGKSTIAELLLGVRRPSSGVVLRDGIPADSLRPAELYDEAVLAREDGIFTGTLRDNLTMGNALPDGSVWEALEKVGLAPTVRKLPNGLETELTPTGAPLSDLQKSAALLARSLLLQPRLLIVDDLLDGAPEAWVDRWLGCLLDDASPWTLLLLTSDPAIANRLPTVLEIREGALHVRPRLTTV
jgi:ABC-type bacteriocin/lantibiotic exporter with double-glycine peptidase domain